MGKNFAFGVTVKISVRTLHDFVRGMVSTYNYSACPVIFFKLQSRSIHSG